MFCLRVSWSNVLWAVPVEGRNLDQNRLFDPARIVFNAEPGDEFPVGTGDHFHVPEDFESAPVGVVHQEQRYAIVRQDVAGRYVLAVTFEIGIAQCAFVQQAKKAWRTATELNIRLARLGTRSNIEAVTPGNEHCLFRPKQAIRFATGFAKGMGAAASHLLLDGFHRIRKRQGFMLVTHVAP